MMRFIAACCICAVIFHEVKPDGPAPPCPCASKAYCNPATDWSKTETLIVTNKTTDYKKWLWNTFTTVIEWNSNTDVNMSSEIMCFAHSQGKKYGIYVHDFPTDVNKTSVYITETANIISYKRADVVVINLVDYLGPCHYTSFHVDSMINLITTVLGGIKKIKTTKLLCLMPWIPPCYESNCDLGPALAKQCDGVVFSPESYNTYCSESCTAKPTVSYSKIDIGIAEYTASGFNRSQLIIGIPWHGYNYTCSNNDKVNELSGQFVCHLKKKMINGTNGEKKEICDLEGSRRRVSVGNEIGKVPEMALLDSTYIEVDQSPYKLESIKNGDTVQNYMTWFEDIGSLMAKYEVVSKFRIKGCMIFTADDLSYTNVKTNKEFDDHMWAWMLHSIFSNGTTQRQEPNMNVAGTVAGVGVGMFLLGFVLGALILCIIFRRQKKLRPPFSHDVLADEFKDDDDHNQL